MRPFSTKLKHNLMLDRRRQKPFTIGLACLILLAVSSASPTAGNANACSGAPYFYGSSNLLSKEALSVTS